MAALAAGMLYNVQVFEEENSSYVSWMALENVAVAQSEDGSPNRLKAISCSNRDGLGCGSTSTWQCTGPSC